MNLYLFESPLSVILAISLLLLSALIGISQSPKKVISGKKGKGIASTALSISAILVAIEGTFNFSSEIHRSVPFIIIVAALLVFLGSSIFENITSRKFSLKLFTHTGLFLMIAGGFFGAPDHSDSQIAVTREVAENTSYTTKGEIVPLPFKIRLKEFQIEYYEDGKSPKQYRSTLEIDGKEFTTQVNSPCRYHGYLLLQADYDHTEGKYSVLRVVKDPWLPVVFIGMALLTIGALLMLKKVWNNTAILIIALVLAVVFGIVSVARINFGTLMPALRSLWFIPHLIIYMLAYSMMAISLISGLFFPSLYDLSRKIFASSSHLLLLGMLCGAVWAQYAWGSWWEWDPKECWAAATWLLSLSAMHIPGKKKKKRLYLLLVILSFLAIQITWYGVNWLPSAQFSMHTYN